jgi:uncharacterized protein
VSLHVQLDLKVPMHDGTLLSADIYRPSGAGPLPALLCRTIYDNQQPRYVEWARDFAEHGYAVVLQDCRGRYDSEGVWEPYVCEAADGFDTQQWVGTQPWCNGRVGTFGISYVAFTQVQTAPLRSPYLQALVPTANQEDNFGHIYCDGVLQLQNTVNFGWIGRRSTQATTWPLVDVERLYLRLPLLEALDDVTDRPIYRFFLQHPTYDDYWKSYSLKGRYPEIDTPAQFITGWYDNLVHEVFKCFAGWSQQARGLATRTRTRLLVGPWTHRMLGSADRFGDVEFGLASATDIPGVHLRWYDRRLKDLHNGLDDEPALRLFVMGTNAWRDERAWPLERTVFTPYYLHSGGRANSLFGDGTLSTKPPNDEQADTFVYDPAHPVPTLGGQSMFVENGGPRDRRPVERRDDVLVYSTPPLDQDCEITGPVELVLHAASSAVDTDFTATLVDVHPNGQAINICEGILRTRFRESLEDPGLIEPGRVYTYRISLWETSNVFRVGHRIRLEVSSSNFPRFNRNLNTGEELATGTRLALAEQAVLHTRAYPSHLLLPVIPT